MAWPRRYCSIASFSSNFRADLGRKIARQLTRVAVQKLVEVRRTVILTSESFTITGLIGKDSR